MFQSRVQSVLFVLISVGLFAMTSVMAKLLATDGVENQLHPFQVSASRFIFGFLAVLFATIVFRVNLVSVPWKLHLGRSVFGWLGISCLFIAAAKMPLADANAISFTSVIVTMALSIFLLQEKVGATRWLAAFVALVGALLIARPGTSAFQYAAIYAMLAAVFIGVETIAIKMLSMREKPIRILFINNLVGACLSLIVLPIIWIQPTMRQWFVLIAVGCTMVVAQYFNIMAMQKGDVSYVAPFWYAAPVFAGFYDFLLFREIVSVWSGLGVLLIIVGGFIITRRSVPVSKSG